jgi:hypothetical protein
VCITFIGCRAEKRTFWIYMINALKFDEKYYIKDKKNKLKAKNGVTTY